MREHHYLRGYLCASGGAVLWGLSGTAGQYLLHHYQVDSFLDFQRTPAYSRTVAHASSHTVLQKMIEMMKSRRNALLLFCYAVFGLLMSQTAFYATIEHANAATAAVLQTLSVVMMALFVCLRSWRVPTRAETISILLALAGVFLIVTNGNLSAMILSPKALSWGLLAALANVCYSFIAQDLVWHWGSITVNALGMLVGGLIFCLLLQPWNIPVNLDFTGWTLFAAVILIGTVMTYILFLRGVGDIGPVKATLLGTLEPVTSAIAGSLFLGTVFYPLELIGFACVLITVFIVTLQGRQIG